MFLLGPEWQGVNWWTSLEGLMVQFPFKKDNPGPASQFCCAMVSFREFLSHIFTGTWLILRIHTFLWYLQCIQGSASGFLACTIQGWLNAAWSAARFPAARPQEWVLIPEKCTKSAFPKVIEPSSITYIDLFKIRQNLNTFYYSTNWLMTPWTFHQKRLLVPLPAAQSLGSGSLSRLPLQTSL